MAVKQISVFIENKSGGLAAITDELAAANINLRALSIAETSDFGVLRLIVDDVFEAGNVLRENGHIYTITDVIAVAAEDKPGSVAKIGPAHGGYAFAMPRHSLRGTPRLHTLASRQCVAGATQRPCRSVDEAFGSGSEKELKNIARRRVFYAANV